MVQALSERRVHNRQQPIEIARADKSKRKDEAKKTDDVATRSFRAPPRALPTLTSARDTQARVLNDPAAQLRARVLQGKLDGIADGLGKVDRKRTGDSRPAGEPFAQPTPDEMNAIVAKADGGDLDALDRVDNFRQTLTPELQAQYDARLAELREDGRIQFDYGPGGRESAATEDMALRGMLASTFPDERALNDTLTAASKDGHFRVVVYPGSVPVGDYYPGSTGGAAGLALPEGGIAIDQQFLFDKAREGDNAFVHEFAHVQEQRSLKPDSFDAQDVPADFPDPDGFRAAYDDEHFQAWLDTRFGDGVRNPGDIQAGGIESYPTAQNLFRQYPEELARENPELYRQMVEYTGYDPMTRKTGTPVRLNGEGSLDQAAPQLRDHFDVFSGGDGGISQDDLRNVLTSKDPGVTQEMRAAAAYLLSSQSARSLLDVGAGRGGVDGNISANDVTGAIDTVQRAGGYSSPTAGVDELVDTREEAEAVMRRYEALADTAAGRGGRDHYVSENDLRALVADRGVPAEVRQAALLLLGLDH